MISQRLSQMGSSSSFKGIIKKESADISSFLTHMFKHQNLMLFQNYIHLNIVNEENKRNLVIVWTHILSDTYEYYVFSPIL